MKVDRRMTTVEWNRGRARSSSFGHWQSAIGHRLSFTLIELVVVMALMSTALGLVVFRLDGFTETGRVRSAGAQLAAWVQLSQSEAVVSGVPRLLRYDLDTSRLVLHKPASRNGSWSWDDGAAFEVGGGVQIQRVVREGAVTSDPHEDASSVRIDPEGRIPSHAVVLALHERFAVLILRSFAEPRLVLRAKLPQAQAFDLLLTELALEEDPTKR